MKIEQWNINKPIPYDRNPRIISDDAIDQVANSLSEAGWQQPIVVNKDGIIIVGHTRLKAAKKLGMEKVPVLVADLTKEQEDRYRLRDNKSGEFSAWDIEMLSVDWEAPELQDLGFDLSDLNIDIAPEDKDDDMPELQSEPVSAEGDMWILGNHRLICGSSTDAHVVEKLLDGQHPNTMITDPPYGVKYEADWRANAKGREKTEREETSSLMNDDQADWYDAYALFQGSVAYVWHASAFTDVVMDGLRRAGFEVKQQIIWNKNVHALSRSDYHWKHEPCWYAVKPKADRNWQGGRSQMTVWDIPSVMFEDGKTAHPTQKPVEVYTRSITHHTNEGEYVYEPFAGSGTSIIACEKLNRRSLSVELDPKFVDLIINRWQDFTGKEAVHENGKTFAELSNV